VGRSVHIVPLLLWGVLLLMISSCATIPPLIRGDTEPPPPWIETVYDPSAPVVHLVAFGNGETRREAQQRAQADAAVQIAYLLSRRAGQLGTYSQRNAQDILDATAEHRSADLSVEERWFFPDNHVAWGVFTLLHYEEPMIQEDLAQVHAQLSGAVSTFGSGDSGAELHPLQRVQLAMIGRIPAGQDEQQALLHVMLQDTQEIIWSVSLDHEQFPLGESPGTRMHVTIAGASGDTGKPDQAEARMVAHIRGPFVDGAPVERNIVFTTSSSGTASVEIAGLPLAGDYTIVITPEWLLRHRDRWEEVLVGRDETETLQEILAALTVRRRVEVTSNAAMVPTAVIITDRDIAGNLIPHNDSSRGLVQILRDQGFRVEQRIVSPAIHRELLQQQVRTVADLYDILPFDVIAGMERLIIGTAEIVEFSEGDRYSLRIQLRAEGYDLLRERHLGDIRIEERVSGGDPHTLIRTGFLSAGRQAARRFGPRLP